MTTKRWETFIEALRHFGEDESDGPRWEALKRTIEALSREELQWARSFFAIANHEDACRKRETPARGGL